MASTRLASRPRYLRAGRTGSQKSFSDFNVLLDSARSTAAAGETPTEPGFDWTIQAYRDVRCLRELLGPLLGPVKVAQMDLALVRFEKSPHRRRSGFRLFPRRSNLA
jgi:hypothetical protein